MFDLSWLDAIAPAQLIEYLAIEVSEFDAAL